MKKLIVSINPQEWRHYKGHRNAIDYFNRMVAEFNFDNKGVDCTDFLAQFDADKEMCGIKIIMQSDTDYVFGSQKGGERGFVVYGTITRIHLFA